MMYKVYKKSKNSPSPLIAVAYHLSLGDAHRLCDNATDRDEYHYLIYQCA